MSGVDNRVVSIKFDNSQFQQKIQETLKALDKLNSGVALSGAKQGMQDLSASAGRFNLDGISASIDGVNAKFVAFAAAGIAAITNLVNRVVDGGLRMAKSLALDPIIGGFQEYELKMGSIQTIMSGSGESLDTVNKKLQELNTYSDKTIYSFKDMTSNIGKFTNSGLSLDQSVASIQGIANVAALSGANAEEASRAMYNFAQSLSSGSVKLMDWKSIENANMATAGFKTELLNSAVAAGTLTKGADGLYKTLKGTPVSATKGFNESLEQQWLTTEALNATLARYSDETTEIGKKAFAAATDVKTFSQMVDTVKESIGSGWASTSELLLGDFEQSKALWTGLNNAIGGWVSDSANARNEMLSGWKGLGGRDVLIQGFKDAFKGLGTIIKPISEAFREMFPKKTALDLAEMTAKFGEFAKKIAISGETAAKIKSVFSGFFSVIKIGIEIVKGIFSVIGDMVGALSGAGSGVLGFSAGLGDMLTHLKEVLVDGGGIAKFFDMVGAGAAKAVGFLSSFISKIASIFAGSDDADKAGDSFTRLGEKLSPIQGIAERLSGAFGKLKSIFETLGAIVGKVWDKIKDVFGNFGDNISEMLKGNDYSGAVDAINVGLLGGILLALKKFLKNGIDLHIGDGLMDKIDGMFKQLTGTLKAMETQLKAEALMKIAIAMGVLTASILVLSLIDSASLSKALVAIGVGFGELVVVMKLLEGITSDAKTAAKLVATAGAMILVAGAVLVLSLAIRMLSGLSMTELGKGLIGVGVGLKLLVLSIENITTDTKGLVKAGIAMIAISVALIVLALAMKTFATMSWTEMAKGMAGVAGGLLALSLATNAMPKDLASQGLGILLIAVAMVILAKAVEAFGSMDIPTLAKGIGAIGVALVIIAGAMRLMPKDMILTSAGILLLSVALNVMAKAVETMGAMKMGELAKGIGAIAAILLILSIATNSMTAALPGAIAMVVVAGALTILGKVIEQLGSMSVKEIAIGLGAIAAALLILGLAALVMTPIIPALLSLGLAITAVGLGFALFGAGAFLVAKAFEALAKAGKTGIKVLVDIIKELIKALPSFIGALADGLIEMAKTFLDAAPEFIKVGTEIVSKILDALIKLLPKFFTFAKELISGIIDVLREEVPKLITMGLELLLALLTGIRDNIYQLTTVVIEILTGFAQALTDNMPMLVTAAATLIISFLTELGNHAQELVDAGVNLLVQFLSGVTNNVEKIVTAVGTLITTFIGAIAGLAADIVTAGVNALVQFLSGMTDNIVKVGEAVLTLISTFIQEVGRLATEIAKAGTDTLVSFLNAIADDSARILGAVATLVTKFVGGVAALGEEFISSGTTALIKFLSGITDNLILIVATVTQLALKFLWAIAQNALIFAKGAADALIYFINGLAEAIRQKDGELRDAGRNLAAAILDGMTLGLSSGAGAVIDKITGIAGGAIDAAKGMFGIKSPSRVFRKIGENVSAGLALGIASNTSPVTVVKTLAEQITDTFRKAMGAVPALLAEMHDVNPVITPVLDLTKIKNESKTLSDLFGSTSIEPNVSFIQAKTLSKTADVANDTSTSTQPSAPTEVKFEQNIYSPTALSANDIYRNTKGQIALAKEELGI